MTPENHKDFPFGDDVVADYLRGWLTPAEEESIKRHAETDREFADYLLLMRPLVDPRAEAPAVVPVWPARRRYMRAPFIALQAFGKAAAQALQWCKGWGLDVLFVLLALVVSSVVLWRVCPSLVDETLSRLDWWISLVDKQLRSSIALGGLSAVVGMALIRLGYLHSKFAVTIPSLTLCLLWLIPRGVADVAELEKSRIDRSIREKLAHRWVSYSPPDLNPYREEDTPNEDTLRRQLKQLFDEGFDGLITYMAHGSMQDVPRLAKEIGYKAVIMGIYIDDLNPNKRIEHTTNAIAASPYVDAYCLGQFVPAPQVEIHKLARWMSELRHATGRPVTSTFNLVHYLGERGKALREIGDFYFPDVCGAFRFGTTPERAFDELRQSVDQLSQLPKDKPVLLKTICYPSGGAPGLTEDTQYQFYERVFRELNFPEGVYVSFYNAYDLPFTRLNPGNFMPADEFVGLFKANGVPKRVVTELFSTDRFPVIAPFGISTPLLVPMRGTVLFTRPKGALQHQPYRARYFKVSRQMTVEWDKSDQELTIQVYQRNSLQGEWKGVRSGSVLSLPTFDAAKEQGIRAGEPMEVKAWIEGEELPETSIWVSVQ